MTQKTLDAKSIWRKSLKLAIASPGNVISGAVAVAASAAFWNPLPLIIWGLGSTGWTIFASTGQSLQKKIEAEEAREKEAKAAAEREALRQKVEISLNEPPIGNWVRRGVLPDYMQVYRRLADLRDKVSRVLKDRAHSETVTDDSVLQQMDYMLAAYLHFVRERLVYVYILANLRAGGGTPQEDPARQAGRAIPPPPPPPAGFAANRWERVTKKGGKAEPAGPASLPSVDERLEEIDEKIVVLQQLAKKEPATARTREWHAGILEKQRELLLECQKRDQCVDAQLGAFLDVFEVILGRVSASQFSATEIATYMGSVVSQIEETERFVASMQPAMDELMGGLEPGLSRWSAASS